MSLSIVEDPALAPATPGSPVAAVPAAASPPAPGPAPAPVRPTAPGELFFNRELSQLAFNRRVIELAADRAVPLLERMRFLSIASSNLDEFFEIRVAGLKKQAEARARQTGPDGLTADEVLGRISAEVRAMVDEQYRVLNDELFPALEAEGIRFLRRADWTAEQAAWVRAYFEAQLLPIVNPIRLDPAHPFPRVLNKALHFIVQVEGTDAFGQDGGLAVVGAPRHLPRVVQLPGEAGKHDFTFLSSIIHAHVGDLFPGMEVTGCYQFRLTRNGDLFVDAEEVEDLKAALEGELPARRYGEEVRLEVAKNCPDSLCRYLLERAGLDEQDLFRLNGPVNLSRLIEIPNLVARPELKYPRMVPAVPARAAQGGDLFRAISDGDVLLHHPYQSFSVVLDFLRQAAVDPDVVAIKLTLYRAGAESVLEDALLAAAHAGKVVTVVIELLARFDEAANISIADRLQEAGATVVYGVVGFKTHAKMLMVVRREGGGLRRYVHLSTGNYHARTARQYTDLGLMTCDPAIGEDVHKIFLQLTGLGREPVLERLLESPFTMHKRLLELIAAEADAARAGKPARIVAKMNAITEPSIIEALYAASQAGVAIDLIVRGPCCLRPGVAGLSDKIRVRSVLGRFLEHTRIFYFESLGDPRVYLASADWMGRNMKSRIETGFPVLDPRLKKTVIEQGLEVYLRDNTSTWELGADGAYRRVTPDDGTPFTAQSALISAICGGDGGATQPHTPESDGGDTGATDRPRKKKSRTATKRRLRTVTD